MNKNILMVVGLIVGLAVGFFGGMQYQKSQVSSQRQGTSGQFRRFGGNSTNGQAPVLGSIVSQDSNSITVKLQDGSTKLILLSGTTAVNKTDPGTVSDLKTGDNVLVTGTTNSDGSVTAQNVMINPMFRGGNRPQSSASPAQQ